MHHVNNHIDNHIDILISRWLFFGEPLPTVAFRNHSGGGQFFLNIATTGSLCRSRPAEAAARTSRPRPAAWSKISYIIEPLL